MWFLRAGRTVISSVGIGDQVDQVHNATPLLDYIDAQFDAHIEDELQTERDPSRTDTRVHACIYLLPPTGRDLKQSDLGIMSKLQNKVQCSKQAGHIRLARRKRDSMVTTGGFVRACVDART